jgi:signal recognition particle GTPase
MAQTKIDVSRFLEQLKTIKKMGLQPSIIKAASGIDDLRAMSTRYAL